MGCITMKSGLRCSGIGVGLGPAYVVRNAGWQPARTVDGDPLERQQLRSAQFSPKQTSILHLLFGQQLMHRLRENRQEMAGHSISQRRHYANFAP
jgi:hypothetical protein